MEELPLCVIPNAIGENTKQPIACSNATFSLPDGLSLTKNYLSEQEQCDLLEEINNASFRWEGFDQRRRVQRYHMHDTDAIPEKLRLLARRFQTDTNLDVGAIMVEESPKSASRQFTTTGSDFESSAPASLDIDNDKDNSSRAFAAYIPLSGRIRHHMNKPIRRHVDCWNVESDNHVADLYIDPGAVLLKRDESLWDWRCYTECMTNTKESVILVKLYSLPLSNDKKVETKQTGGDLDNFGYIPNTANDLPRGPMPPMQDILTVIVTTSPIKSNPSTEMLEKTFETFPLAGTDFEYNCPKLIVCDGYRKQTGTGEVTTKHSNIKQTMRNGIVTDEQADNYIAYKQRLKELCASATSTSPFNNTTVVELDERQGYGFALRHALRHCVDTPYVCVIQHDRTFMRPTPIQETLNAMWNHRNIKFVGMSMRSNLTYRDIFSGKYGKTYLQELKSMILRVPELLVDSALYGPDSDSTRRMNYGTPKQRENLLALMETYKLSLHYRIEQEYIENNSSQHNIDTKTTTTTTTTTQLSLTPTLYWYDNTHLCETAHYRDFIFCPKYKMVAKGGFVEDKCSPVMKRTVERLGLTQGHERFGCFILDDHSGLFFTGHLDGGAYLTRQEKQDYVQKKKVYGE